MTPKAVLHHEDVTLGSNLEMTSKAVLHHEDVALRSNLEMTPKAVFHLLVHLGAHKM
jgi:hypothetical protein